MVNSDNQPAWYYDAYMADYQEDLPYWLALAERFPGPVLELGCGTGRVARALLQAGHSYTGLDSDPAMLALCRARLKGLSEAGSFAEADMTGFRLAQQYSLIISPCNTYSTLDAGQRAATLQAIHTHLMPGGCFAACVPNPHALADTPAVSETDFEDSFTHPMSGNPVQISTAYARQGEWLALSWHFDHLLPDGGVERTTITTRHAMTTRQVYLAELASAGLIVHRQAGDFDNAAFTRNSPALLWEALKLG